VRREWVVLIEAERDDAASTLLLGDVERLVELLADDSPGGLWSVDRYALQLVVPAADADAAVGPALGKWRAAVARLDLPQWQLVRLEVKTTAELEAELRCAGDGSPVGRAPTSEEALRAAYEATRELLSIRSRADAAVIVGSLARRLGATLVPPDHDEGATMALDLSFGAAEPVLASADPISVSRLQLEEVLPTVVLDALRVVHLVDRAEAGDREAPRDGDTQLPAPAGF
jgi:hypothetical protein